jgi:hypothetical protein
VARALWTAAALSESGPSRTAARVDISEQPFGEVDAFTDLLAPPLKWRDIEVPCMANGVSFAHGQAEHRQHGVDGASIEPTGREPARLTFKIPFLVGIAGFGELYPKKFRDFWNACLDGSKGSLAHPEFGEIDACCKSFNLSIDPSSRSGYMVDVEWTETIEDGVSIADSPLGAVSEALGLAENWDRIRGDIYPVPTYDDGTDTDPLTALKRLQGQLLLAQLSVQDALLSIDRIVAGVNGAILFIDSVVNPNVSAWTGRSVLERIESNLQEARDKVAPSQQRIELVIASADIEVREAASASGMGLEAFLRSNPKYGATKTIRAGQEYFVVGGAA